MPRGGYYAGSDYVPYSPGTLTKSTKTSLAERKKQKTVKCPNCGRIVPSKEYCIFCDKKLK
ncbi:hypothetical protein [Methanobrevibacter sp.]